MFLFIAGGYYSVRFIVYRIVASQAFADVRFRDVDFSLFPLGVRIKNVENFTIKSKNLLSFRSVNITFLMESLFSKKKAVKLEIVSPKVHLDESFLQKKGESVQVSGKWDIQRIDIVDGEIHFRSQDIDVDLFHFDLRSRQKPSGNAFQFQAPMMEVRLVIERNKKKVLLAGPVSGALRGQGGSWKINRFFWQTDEITMSGNGKISKDGSINLHSQVRGNPRGILAPVLEEFNLSAQIAGKADISRNKNGNIWIQGDFSGDEFTMKKQSFFDLRGRISWDNQEDIIAVETFFRDERYSASLQVHVSKHESLITGQRLSARSLSRILEIETEAPLTGLVQNGEVKITKKFITGKINFDNGSFEIPADSPFKITGEVTFSLDERKKSTSFSGKDLLCNAGKFSLSGRVEQISSFFHLEINAALFRLENLDPFSKYYIDLDLASWKLRDGNGRFQLDLDKAGERIATQSRIDFSDFYVNGEHIENFNGELSGKEGRGKGVFEIRDNEISGPVHYSFNPQETVIDFPSIEGETRKAMRILDLDIGASGRASGMFRFTHRIRNNSREVTGNWRADRLIFENVPLEQASSKFISDFDSIHLKDLKFTYRGGEGSGDVFIDYTGKRFSLSGSIQPFDLASSVYGGKGAFQIKKCSGRFFEDPVEIDFQLSDVSLYPDRPLDATGKIRLMTDFSNYLMDVTSHLHYGSKRSDASLHLMKNGDSYSGDFNLMLKDLNLIIPWKNNIGELEINGKLIPLDGGKTSIQGVAHVSGETLVLPNFSHTLKKFQGSITFRDNVFDLQPLTGEIGGGQVLMNGRVVMDHTRLQDMILYFRGNEMELYPMDRVQCRTNADLTLTYSDQRLKLRGHLNFLSGLWGREVDESISFYTSTDLTPEESKILSMLEYDIRMTGKENIQMNNSFGRALIRFQDLHLTGTYDSPILLGTIEAQDGELFFSARSFKIVKARLHYNNRFINDPRIQVESETDVQNYRIRFNIKGTVNQMKPEFSSSPPLPVPDILALISLGEIYKRSGSTELSSQMGSAAMISSKLTEEIKNRANKLLGIDLLRIDPLMNSRSSTATPQLTIGKSISKNLTVVYSTNLSTSRQDVLYFQYQITPSISVIGMRMRNENEEGKYSIDIRFRKRR